MSSIKNIITQSDSREVRAEHLAVRLISKGIDTAIGIPGTGPVLNFVSTFKKKRWKSIIVEK